MRRTPLQHPRVRRPDSFHPGSDFGMSAVLRRRDCSLGGLSAILVAMTMAAGASAQPLAWVRLPAPSEIQAIYPDVAKERGIIGHAWIDCAVRRDGSLSNCRPSTESPAGLGFAAAALKLAPSVRAEPQRKPVRVLVPVHFGPATPERPVRTPDFKTKQGRFNIEHPRFRKLAPIGPYWPDSALRFGMAGRTAVDCKVQPSGALTDCTIVGEMTSHPSFGESALRMALDGWMTAGPPPTGATEPADGIWRFVIDYPPRSLEDTS